ncbi:major facilitator superfamily domain-containing protein 8-like [Patiria miniata]|uniref:Major facilitator superfamily (MFS) profile domain-containing protein n=1 Tax=Patiria miniata TaxID=46514 RepID=A0A913ZU09_PATMI|nr:major facilitator superfamily domain-containing protein 8-like [Patiria miniata]
MSAPNSPAMSPSHHLAVGRLRSDSRRSRAPSVLDRMAEKIGADMTLAAEYYEPTQGTPVPDQEPLPEIDQVSGKKLSRKQRKKLQKEETMKETGETSKEYDSRWTSIYIVFLCVFLSGTGFSLILPSVWPYLQQVDSTSTTNFLGFTVASFGLAQCFGSLLFGWWADYFKSVKRALIYSAGLTLIGNLVYFAADFVPNNARWVVMAGRFFIGLGAGDVALGRTYVASATTVRERTDAVALMSACISIGYITGPLLQTAFATIGYPGWAFLNMYSVPVLFSAVIGVGNIALLAVKFKDAPVADRLNAKAEEARRKSKAGDNLVSKEDADKIQMAVNGLTADSNHNSGDGEKRGSTASEWSQSSEEDGAKLDVVAVIVINILFCVTSFIFSALDTVGTALVMDEYGLIQDKAILYQGLLLASVAFQFIIVVLLLKPLKKIMSERAIFLLGFVIAAIGIFVMLPWGNTFLSDISAQENQALFDEYLGGVNPWPEICGDAEPAGALSMSAHQPFSIQGAGGEQAVGILSGPVDAGTSNLTYGVCWELYEWCCRSPRIYISQYLIGFLLSMGVSYGFCFIMASTIYSKVLGLKNQGKMMGYLTAAGSLSRIIGPIYIGQMYGAFGPRLSFAIILAMLIAAVFLCTWFYSRLVPFGMRELYQVHYSDMEAYMARKNNQGEEQVGEGKGAGEKEGKATANGEGKATANGEGNTGGTYISIEDTNL